ncbi:MAG: protein translocase subunit SecD [Kiritimatiellaeota bacterium]|nr:protein translocase subunit SecD [Kiritimatiellota bacterium]
MSRNDLLKWLVLAILAMLSAYVVYPPFETEGPDGTKRPGKIRRGLDLSGGASFTVAIDEERMAADLRAENPDMDEQTLRAKVRAALKDADSRTIEVIRNRIDKTGINEPVIQAGKDHRINIQLPGITPEKYEEAEKSIRSAAFLEFKLVHAQNDRLVDKLLASGHAPEGYILDGRSFRRGPDYKGVSEAPDYFSRLSLFEVPDPRYAFMLEKASDGSYSPIFVLRKAELTGDALSSARVERNQITGKQHIALNFNAKGTAEFARVTKAYAPRGSKNKDSDVGRQLAIIMDDTLYSAPVIKSEIPSGQAQITGNFSPAEANQLRNILNAGSLPAPMKILEQRSISPTLGEDAVKRALNAGLVGIVIIMAFMLAYYTYCGLVANVALVLNLLLLPVGLVFASNVLGVFVPDSSGGASNPMALPVLTMPGIAGIMLTIGMAVDANVLIFERIREEFATGKSTRTAVAAGYDRAFLAIFDSNITTLLTAAILFIFGAGPIRGYAIMLSAGILISMFTALVVTRLVFNATVPEASVKPFKMFQMIKSPSFDFIKPAKLCIITSVSIVVITCAIFAVRVFKNPSDVMAVDFVGGAAVTYSYKEKASDIEIKAIAEKAVNNDATVQYQSTLDSSGDLLLIKTSVVTVGDRNSAAVILDALNENFPQCAFAITGDDIVGSAVGDDLKRAATQAVIISLIGILIYVSLRFEFGFALGAVAALAHDALFTFGVYSLFGRQMSLTTVAALLTIVGYSVNNTIVIFDRIRETLRKDFKTDFKTLCNQALNATLSRTMLTSLTTIMAALSLFLFGGVAISDFSFAMLIGLLVGTYTSLIVAPTVMLAWYSKRRPFAPKDK